MLLNPADASTLEGYDASQLTTADTFFYNPGLFSSGSVTLYSESNISSAAAGYVVPFTGEIYLAAYKATHDAGYPSVSWQADIYKNYVLLDSEVILYAGALPSPGVLKALAYPVVTGDIIGARAIVNAAGLRAPWVKVYIRRATA